MKKYKVNVNGTDYEIAIEVIDEKDVKTPVKEAVQAPAEEKTAGGETVNSPMPGNILSVNIKVGDAVKKGDVLMVLEAMKMENEIMAGVDGKVLSVNVDKGATVETGTVLCVIG